MRALAILAVLSLAPFTDAISQALPLQPGQRVRVTVPSLEVVSQEEAFRSLRRDTLVLGSLRCPLTDVARLEVHAGRRAFAGRGALIGAGAGVLIGIPIGVMEQSRYECDPETSLAPCISPLPTIPLMFGVLGAGLGALTGSLIKKDRWEEVPLDRLQVSIAPTRNGFGLGARIAF